MKRIISGTSSKPEFECPRDICYYNKSFYVLDQGSFSIDQFTHNGEFLESFYFNKYEPVVINPWSVRVNRDTMAIIDWKEKIFIFDLNKNLKHVIFQPYISSICFISDNLNSLQLFGHSENGDFKGYELNGDLKPHVIYEENSSKLKYRSEFMLFSLNQKFLLSFGWAKALAVISMNSV